MSEAVISEPSVAIQFVNRMIADAINRGSSAVVIDVVKWESGRTLPLGLGPHSSDETVSEIESARVQFRDSDDWEPYAEYRMAFHPAIVNRIRAMSGIEYWKKGPAAGRIRVSTDGGPWIDIVVAIESSIGYDEVRLQINPQP